MEAGLVEGGQGQHGVPQAQSCSFSPVPVAVKDWLLVTLEA